MASGIDWDDFDAVGYEEVSVRVTYEWRCPRVVLEAIEAGEEGAQEWFDTWVIGEAVHATTPDITIT